MSFQAAPTVDLTARRSPIDDRESGSAGTDRWQRRSAAAVLAVLGLGLLALGGRLVYINTSLDARLLALARQQQNGRLVIPAPRGMILDTKGRVVAASQQRPDVFVDPSLVDDLETLALELGVRVDLPASEIAARIQNRAGSRFVVIAPQVDEVTAASVRAMSSPADNRRVAVGLSDRETRTFPLGPSMAHVLGFVGRDGHGLEGIELTYDEHLCGEPGRRATIRDARRRALWPLEGATSPPVDGGHVVLTIDAEIQRLTEARLEIAIGRFEAESGVAIVMSPRDGAILAMACWPGYDPRVAASQPADIRRNRALTDTTEPGSTFKPFIACGALAGGFVSTTELIDCQMGAHYFGHRLVKDSSPHGAMTIKGIITKSSNIGMTMIGYRMGNDALYETVRRFGFGSPTGIDYPGENRGLVHPLERWTSYSTSSIPFGYELTVTPLQLITAFGAIVNDGVLLKPRLVRRLLAPNGEVVQSFEQGEIVRRVVSSEVARYMAKDLLVSAVLEGTGRRAGTGPYRVLGKTGTAKLPFAHQRGYQPGAYVGTFMGAAPADDPQVAAVVMIRRPNAALGYYGGTVAAPAVRDILCETLAYMEVPVQAKQVFAGL